MDQLSNKRRCIFGFTLVVIAALLWLLAGCSPQNPAAEGEEAATATATAAGTDQEAGEQAASTGMPEAAPAATPVPTATPTPQPKEMTVAEAMLDGLIEWSFHPSTADPAHTMILLMRRLAPAPLNLNIPSGSMLANQDPAQASFIVGGLLPGSEGEAVQSIVLDDLSWQETPLEVYSINYTAEAPGITAEFSLVDPVSSEVQLVLEAAAQTAGANQDTLQAAIWVITDGINAEQAQQLKAYQAELLPQIFENAGIDLARKRIFDRQNFSDPNSYLTRGNQYSQQGEFAQAIGDYSDGIRILESADASTANADEPAANAELLSNLKFSRGMAYLRKQDQAAAIQDFQDIIELGFASALGYYGLGAAYSSGASPDYQKALAALDQCLSLADRFTEAYYSRGMVYTALGYNEKGYYVRAIEDFSKAIDLDENFVEAYFARGQANGARGFDNHALKDFKRVLELDEQRVEAYRERGRIYAALGEKPRAISEFVKYLTRKPDAPDRAEVQAMIHSLEGVLPTPQAGQTASLEDAVRQKWVELQVEAVGVTSGDSVRLRVSNLLDRQLNISVPSGALLLSATPAQTDMVVRKLRGLVVSESELQPVEQIALEAGASQDYFAEAYSLDFFKGDPQAASVYTLAGLAEPEVARLLDAASYVPGAAANVLAIQAAIWSLVSNIRTSDLAAIPMSVDLEIVRALLESAGANLQCTALFGSGDCPVIPEAP